LQREPIVERTARTLTRLPDIVATIRTAADKGYAISDEELALGIRALAVPVFGSKREVIAAVSVSASPARVKIADMRKRFLPSLLRCSSQISNSLERLR
jgi:IclR family pca regulon transcriptional regulator